MKIAKVFLENFKPYYGLNEIDFSTYGKKNVILIGGINGQGKTSFLVSLVWCLYGEKISVIDEVFRKEVKGNYTQYLNRSLNWAAKEKGKTKFSVTMIFQDVELSEGILENAKKLATIEIMREYDIEAGEEKLTIKVDGDDLELVKDEEEKRLFINDYIIPLESAKFIFFNAERIASIADLSIREQGGFLNDALGKILGLSVYENLIEDLENTKSDLKKQSADRSILAQIDANQNAIEIKNSRIRDLESQLEELEERLLQVNKEIASYDEYLIKQGVKPNTQSIAELYSLREQLESSKSSVSEKLFELIEIIPYAISAGNLQELVDQLDIEEEFHSKRYGQEAIKEQAETFVEELFNKEPFPDDDIKFKQKNFYAEKAESLLEKLLLGGNAKEVQLELEHGLSRNDIESVKKLYRNIVYKSKDIYEEAFSSFNKIENELNEVNRSIRRIEGAMQDDIVNEFRQKKEKAERERDKVLGLVGEKRGEIENRLKPEILSLEEKNKNLLDKVTIVQGLQEQINYITKLSATLNEFVRKQKQEKCDRLGDTVSKELNLLMHRKDFINKVSVTILPENAGLEVNLYDCRGERVPQDSLSEGEKQVYISALMKAILEESVVEYPVFIDTPLGRLDLDHRDNMIEYYYPNLSEQVIVLAQNAEIDGKRAKKMKDHLANTYLLKNTGNRTKILQDYFN
ncbi:DNA sulfur modification protein DndD [Flaviaesturariibacter aridisoli]|uniref:DNA sulfur modification protein DndD n=1 Tax=Flaviaesturariibacter aridisoli TaxID=2545761 RepID=A0A4R4E5C9_9BACT|nr:DNA sulfur modification protein DndD [Flaviaesturariibacter aridisoli]TCZ74063.1 DNA sulfur modification protein DndD [Flaviaesturariibacter aridisoli]